VLAEEGLLADAARGSAFMAYIINYNMGVNEFFADYGYTL